MAAAVGKLSLHKVDLQKGEPSNRSDRNCDLYSVPATPSTIASSRNTAFASSADSFGRSTPSSAASWDDGSGLNTNDWLSHRTRDSPLATSSSFCSSFPRFPEGTTSLNLASPAHTDILQTDEGLRVTSYTRPDEELLQSVRTDVVLGAGDSVEFIYELIQSGEDVNQRSESGFTPLAVAAAAGSGSLVSLLMEKAADVMLANIESAELPLHHAASLGHEVVCQLLMPPIRAAEAIDATTSAGWTSLHLAVASNREGIARILLRANAAPDRGNAAFGFYNALHLAALGRHADVLELLLDHDADANVSDSLARTPLHVSAMRADAECVALLLRCKADPLRRGGDGNNTAAELLPAGFNGASCARVHQLLSAYARQMPSSLRTDARFDLPGGHDVLSAYADNEVPWGIPKTPSLSGTKSIVTAVPEWEGEDDDAIWL